MFNDKVERRLCERSEAIQIESTEENRSGLLRYARKDGHEFYYFRHTIVLGKIFIVLVTILLNSCVSQIWTGVSLIYDRHALYHQLSDYHLGVQANRLVFKDDVLRGKSSFVDIAVFNGDVLLTGHLPTQALKQVLLHRVSGIPAQYHLYDQVVVRPVESDTLQDGLITTNIRTQILADSSIDPHAFKVVTTDGIVYLMGEVRPSQAKTVIQFARETNGVRRVVTLLKYYHFISSKEKKA